MGYVYSNSLVAKWIYENYDILDRNLLPVIEYANKTMDKQAFNMMTMARLCYMPEEMEDLSVLAEALECSTQSTILDGSLNEFPQQEKVSFEDLGEIVDFLVLV